MARSQFDEPLTLSIAPILYSFRRCPYAMRARLALAVSGTLNVADYHVVNAGTDDAATLNVAAGTVNFNKFFAKHATLFNFLAWSCTGHENHTFHAKFIT